MPSVLLQVLTAAALSRGSAGLPVDVAASRQIQVRTQVRFPDLSSASSVPEANARVRRCNVARLTGARRRRAPKTLEAIWRAVQDEAGAIEPAASRNRPRPSRIVSSRESAPPSEALTGAPVCPPALLDVAELCVPAPSLRMVEQARGRRAGFAFQPIFATWDLAALAGRRREKAKRSHPFYTVKRAERSRDPLVWSGVPYVVPTSDSSVSQFTPAEPAPVSASAHTFV